MPVVADGAAEDGASLPIAPPPRRDERGEAPTRSYKGRPTFVTAVPTLMDDANTESETAPSGAVADADDCRSAVDDSSRQQQKQQQAPCCDCGDYDDDSNCLNDTAAATADYNNNCCCNRHQAASSVDSKQHGRGRHSSLPPPSAAAATATPSRSTLTTDTAEQWRENTAPKPWTLANKMFTTNKAVRLRSRKNSPRTARQVTPLPRTAPAGLGMGSGSSSSYSKQRPRAPPPTAVSADARGRFTRRWEETARESIMEHHVPDAQRMAAGGKDDDGDDRDHFPQRWDKTAGGFMEHQAAQGQRAVVAAGKDTHIVNQEHFRRQGRLKVEHGAIGITFCRSSGSFDAGDCLAATESEGGTTDGLAPRWRGRGEHSANSSSIWSESSCDSVSGSTWSGASFDKEVGFRR